MLGPQGNKGSVDEAAPMQLAQLYGSRHAMPCRLATRVGQLGHDQIEQGPTEPHAGRSTFLLSSGGAGGRVLLRGPLIRG